MAKPTKRILDWASGGTVTDPGAGKESTGWLVSERPPAFWWNWILQSFGDWLTYFEERTDASPVVIGQVTAGASAAVDHVNVALAGTPITFFDSNYEMRVNFSSAVVGADSVVLVSLGDSHLPAHVQGSMHDTSTLSIYVRNTSTNTNYTLHDTAITPIFFTILEVV